METSRAILIARREISKAIRGYQSLHKNACNNDSPGLARLWDELTMELIEADEVLRKLNESCV